MNVFGEVYTIKPFLDNYEPSEDHLLIGLQLDRLAKKYNDKGTVIQPNVLVCEIPAL